MAVEIPPVIQSSILRKSDILNADKYTLTVTVSLHIFCINVTVEFTPETLAMSSPEMWNVTSLNQ